MENEKPKIAMIDDDEDILEVTQAFLKRRGFEVFTALDGEKGLVLIRETKPDLILLDLMLPGIDGFEVCKQIKEDRNLWHVPIIYFTARGESSEKISGLKSGADDYVTKPFEPEELLARIWMILNRTYTVLDANPLTKLPGNNAIQKQIAYRLEKNEPFAIAHLDIDYFKSFNDEYGFERGDDAIRSLADLLSPIVKEKGNPTDFVGHIGGDDFVIISDPNHMDLLSKEIIHQFDILSPHFYNREDRERGCIVIKDRQGILREFPLMSLSIAVVTNEKRKLTHIGEVNAIAAELKKYVKTLHGSNCVKDRRGSEPIGSNHHALLNPSRELEKMAHAIHEKKINLFFQPIVDVETNVPQGHETLLRSMQAGSVLSQEELFNEAIDLRMERELGRILFEKIQIFTYGMNQNSWILVGLHPRIFLNLLEDPEKPFENMKMNLHRLIYQLRSGDLIRNDTFTKEMIEKIKEQGSQISISLSYGGPLPLTLLSEFKPAFLYLDPSFAAKIAADVTQQTLIKMLVDMNRTLGSQLIVSGVTTTDQKELLKGLGVQWMSGKIFV
ncbi:MAG: response regulator [Chlamydiae bacterium]|nr:response regulator [Chlamydiota bacterium]MBI3278066.1 response regulator [Chlamydiota bacterium]